MNADDIPLPQNWPQHVRSSMLHIISLAHCAIIYSRSWCANSPIARVRLAGKLDRAVNEIAILKEEIRIKDARMEKIASRHRPYYPPWERMAILELKAARGWNLAQTARVFQVEPDTISEWMKRINEQGEHALVQIIQPVNKLPVFVRYVVQRLKTLCPVMGKKRIAELLTAAGLYLSSTTAGRFLKDVPVDPLDPTPYFDQSDQQIESSTSRVTARHPNHVWHIDLTIVPTRSGFWVPWLPLAFPQKWPFCYWISVIIDHFSRMIIAFAVFLKQPSSDQIKSLLAKAIQHIGKAPRHLISDKGIQFTSKSFRKYCKRKKIKPRYGAVGKYGSIAIIERFIRSMKDECTRRIIVPLNMQDMRKEIELYTIWYNEFRPHQAIDGRTPSERYHGLSPPAPIFDSFVKARRYSGVKHKDAKLTLHVSYLEGRKHLPVIELRRAA